MSVTVSPDYMRQLRLAPTRGLLELIKNAFDADATRVEVSFRRSDPPLDAITAVVVDDNGAGMRLADVDRHFRPMGRSWKRRSGTFITPSGRDLFGRYGRGRFGAFGLGELVTWTSAATEQVGASDSAGAAESVSYLTTVTWRGDEDAFDSDEEALADDRPRGVVGGAPSEGHGTRVEVTHLAQACERLRAPQARKAIAEQFFDYLHRYPGVTLIYDGERISPDDLLIERTPLTLDATAALDQLPPSDDGNVRSDLVLEISEWESNVRPVIHLADANGWIIHTIPARVNVPGIAYTAKVLWAGVPKLVAAEVEELDPATKALLSLVRRSLRSFFAQRADDARRALLEQWRHEGSYPYDGEAESSVEEAERDMFDIVAVTAAPALSGTDVPGRTFAFQLLKAAVQTDTTALRNVLEQVLSLGEDEMRDLDELLRRIPLTSMIAMQRTATDRIAFTGWLETILNDDAWVRALTERDGLQDLIESNAWIFGDDWQTVIADKALAAGLTRLRELGMDGDGDVETVLDADGRRIRVDLLLSRSRKAAGRRQNLVVELKRPSQTLRKKELDQLDNYVSTVMTNPQFNDGRIDWTFVLVGRQADEYVDRKRTADDRPVGRVDKQRLENGATYEMKVLTWSEVLEDAKSSLAFLAEHVPDFPAAEDLEALSAMHAVVAPVPG